jgi:putative intracellular protease/amidase
MDIPFQGKDHALRVMRHSIFVIALGCLFFFCCSYTQEPVDKHLPESKETGSKIRKYEPRFGRNRPIVAVVGVNSYTELTDFVVPFGIMKESSVAEVFAITTEPGSMKMFPAFEIDTNFTIQQFDVKFPEGADFVFVPAVHESDNKILVSWLQKQSQKGSTIIGVCDGVWALANARLLEGKSAVGHWYSFQSLQEKFTNTKWISNRRYISDGNIITTTGVTASIPISLAIIEAIAGQKKAEEVAHHFGADEWGSYHESAPFQLSAKHIITAAKNLTAFWSYEDVGIPVTVGEDEVTLALVADVYARTYKTNVFQISDSNAVTKHGLTLLPRAGKNRELEMDRIVNDFKSLNAIRGLDHSLNQIQTLYGLSTANFVALQIEYLKYLQH